MKNCTGIQHPKRPIGPKVLFSFASSKKTCSSIVALDCLDSADAYGPGIESRNWDKENLLQEEFGRDYASYGQKTAKLVPCI